MHNSIVLGIDVGGSHITISQVDLKNRKLIENSTLRICIDSNKPLNVIIDVWVKAILKVIDTLNRNTIKIGIAFPGPFDYENGVCLIQNQDKYENFYNVNIRSLLAEKLVIDGNSIFFINDAACFLKGEQFVNEWQYFTSPLGITLGTGLGSSILQNGQPTDAALWSYPFKDGIAEDYISTRWFLDRYFSLTNNKQITVKQIADSVKEKFAPDHKICSLIFKEFGQNLADFIIAIESIIIPDIIILGGNISKGTCLFQESFNHRLEKLNYKEIKIEISKLGESSAVIGAASFCYSSNPKLIQAHYI